MTTTLDRRPSLFPERFADWFDFPDMARWFDRVAHELIRLEESEKDGKLIIKAEMPGIDPDKDVDITIDGGLMTITAQRREKTEEEAKGVKRSEFRYGSFTRSVRVPVDAKLDDIKATYTDGVLTVVVPRYEALATTATKVPVARV